MKPIKRWVMATFGGSEPKLFLELGAHRGQDTAWMAALPNVTMHAFEPDPRNVLPQIDNVTWHRKAIAGHDGRCQLFLSERPVEWGVETGSSAIREPTGHLMMYPNIMFPIEIEVDCTTLDTATRGMGQIDFIWADIQGAEVDMIEGGAETLAKTRYLFTEYCNKELYAGQITLSEIIARLPAFRLMRQWFKDALLVNTGLVEHDGRVWS